MSDSGWYKSLVDRFGDAVPAAEHLLVSRSMQPHVEQMFEALQSEGFLIDIVLVDVEERTPGWLMTQIRYRRDGLSKSRRRQIDDAISDWHFSLTVYNGGAND